MCHEWHNSPLPCQQYVAKSFEDAFLDMSLTDRFKVILVSTCIFMKHLCSYLLNIFQKLTINQKQPLYSQVWLLHKTFNMVATRSADKSLLPLLIECPGIG